MRARPTLVRARGWDILAVYGRPPTRFPAWAEVAVPSLTLPPRPRSTGYERPSKLLQTAVPDHAATLGKN